MAVITSYATLLTEIANTLTRSDLTAEIPQFVQFAENKLYRRLNIRSDETTLNVRIIDGLAKVPSDYKLLKHAYYDRSPIAPLEWHGIEELYRKFPERTGANVPVAISREADHFVFGQFPADGTLRGVYYRKQSAARNGTQNLLVQSEDLSTTWVLTRATSAQNAGVTPIGSKEANTLNEDGTAANSHFVNQTFSGADDQTYTFSVYLKKSNRSNAVVQIFDREGASITARFDLGNASIYSISDPVGAFIEPLQDDWFRCGVTGNIGVGGTSEAVNIQVADTSGSTILDGLSQESIFVWGLQLEVGKVATDYVKTTASAVTGDNWYIRNAPEVLLYGALLEAAPFMKDDIRIPMWQNFYTDSIQSLMDEDDSLQTSQGALIQKVS